MSDSETHSSCQSSDTDSTGQSSSSIGKASLTILDLLILQSMFYRRLLVVAQGKWGRKANHQDSWLPSGGWWILYIDIHRLQCTLHINVPMYYSCTTVRMSAHVLLIRWSFTTPNHFTLLWLIPVRDWARLWLGVIGRHYPEGQHATVAAVRIPTN